MVEHHPRFEGMPASAKMSAIGFMFFGCSVENGGNYSFAKLSNGSKEKWHSPWG